MLLMLPLYSTYLILQNKQSIIYNKKRRSERYEDTRGRHGTAAEDGEPILVKIDPVYGPQPMKAGVEHHMRIQEVHYVYWVVCTIDRNSTRERLRQPAYCIPICLKWAFVKVNECPFFKFLEPLGQRVVLLKGPGTPSKTSRLGGPI